MKSIDRSGVSAERRPFRRNELRRPAETLPRQLCY